MFITAKTLYSFILTDLQFCIPVKLCTIENSLTPANIVIMRENMRIVGFAKGIEVRTDL